MRTLVSPRLWRLQEKLKVPCPLPPGRWRNVDDGRQAVAEYLSLLRVGPQASYRGRHRPRHRGRLSLCLGWRRSSSSHGDSKRRRLMLIERVDPSNQPSTWRRALFPIQAQVRANRLETFAPPNFSGWHRLEVFPVLSV